MCDGKFHLRSIAFLTLLTVLSFVFSACSNPDKTIEQRFTQAQEKLDEGLTEEAVTILEDLYERWPERLDVVEFLAFAHSRNNNPAAAADAFMLAYEQAPERGDLLLFAAQARTDAGDLAKAARHYRLYIADNFDDFSGWQALARLENDRGLHRDAIDAYLNVYRIRPSGMTAAELGDLFLRLNNTAQAHHWFKASLEHSGEARPIALLGLLRISLEEENWDRAEELVQRLDRDHPGALDASELAMVRGELLRWRESVAELERLRLAQAAESERREAEARAREEEERLAQEKAEAEAAEAARLAALEQDEEETEAGVESLPLADEMVTSLDPFAELVAKADRFVEDGRFGSAARTYWRALSYDDSQAEIWFKLSRAHSKASAWNDAELTVLEALRRQPEREVYHLHYLNVIKETQPVRTYLRELERVQQQFPNNAEVVLALANTYARSQHSHPEAVRYYRLFLQLAPQDGRRPQVEQSIRRLTL
jgi:tetratricopeptide (TPR) repeat protein